MELKEITLVDIVSNPKQLKYNISWPILLNHNSEIVLWNFRLSFESKKQLKRFIKLYCSDNWLSLNPWFRIEKYHINKKLKNIIEMAEIFELSISKTNK